MKTKFYSLISFLVIMICTPVMGQDSRIWATYYGGTSNDGGFSVAADTFGNVYVAGITLGSPGLAWGGFQNNFGGGVVDAYLVKFDVTGNRVWATYYGGTGDEMAFFGGKMGVAVDLAGNVFLAGFTNSTSGIASGGFQNSPGGNAANAYLVKFDDAGNRIWGTYYGGTSVDKAYGVATDADGNIYIAGIANSAGIASGGFQNTMGGGSDALLVKFNSAGNRIWATYYGGSGQEEGYSVATDNAGNVYLAGTTNSGSSIAAGGFQNNYGGGANDLFLVKFDSSGTRLWATYYGGSGDEMLLFNGDLDVATDASGNVFLTGLTSSMSGIASNGFQNNHGGGGEDAFLVKFDATGIRLWATYYGGNDSDKGYSAATDSSGNIYLAGRTDSPNAIASGGFLNTLAGPHDAFLVKFDPEGNRQCATYFGGIDVDECNAIAVDPYNDIYMAGNSANTTDIAWNGFQNSHGGGTSDAFLAKFTSCPEVTQVEENFSNHHITIYPNPSNGNFIIKAPRIHEATVRIFDMTGREVYSFDNFSVEKEINISRFQKGVYCVKIENMESIVIEKIVLK